uniref:Wall-associated receptor kinase galacturonan-binding domain-containing protein n=1 Tax=Leersia perrieri TaxID=77586 RepID=A0A0D9XI56_9ORYZ
MRISTPLLLLLHLTVLFGGMPPAVPPQRPITLPGCPEKCGNKTIPYPFGTKEGCYFDYSFNVYCNNNSFATLNMQFMLRTDAHYLFGPEQQQNTAVTTTNMTWWTVGLLGVDVARGEAMMAMPVSSDCSRNESYHDLTYYTMNLNGSTTFLFSATRNVLLGVGQSVIPVLFGQMIAGTNYSAALQVASLFDEPSTAGRDGMACVGLGCCEATLAPGLSLITTAMYAQRNTMWKTFPCTYSVAELYGYGAFDKKFPDGVPLVLDFAIRNDSCPADGTKTLPMGCRSR